MNRKLKNPIQRRSKPHYRVRRCKHRDFRELYLNDPDLRWVDALLRCFHLQTPPDWLPAQYQPILRRQGWKKRTLH